VHHYQELLTALTDLAHPKHDDAVDWLGDDWNPDQIAHPTGVHGEPPILTLPES
jgi:hypothetical protein